MTNKFFPFPKIHGLDHVIENVEYKHNRSIEDGDEVEYPKISFIGRVKIHGTNGAMIMNPDGQIYCQGRNRIIEGEDDFKFYSFCQNNKFKTLFEQVKDIYFNEGGEEDIDSSHIVLYGEYAGKGIQSKVGVASLDKFFIIFAIRLVFPEDKSKNVWLNLEDYKEVEMPKERIFNIANFPTYKVTIDFADPEASKQTLKDLTNKVAEECPVAKHLGIKGRGEGLVWAALGTDNYFSNVFKTKHDSFLATRRDNVPLSAQVVESIKKFVDMTVTENRLNQGLEFLREGKLDVSFRNMRAFLNWVVDDILVEEESTIEKSKLDECNVKKKIIEKAKSWFVNLIPKESQ